MADLTKSEKKFRIVLVGGGSFQWTPRIATDIALEPGLEGATLVLQDFNEQALETMARYCKLVAERIGRHIVIETETGLRTAAPGADFVLVTISTGGLDAMAHDLAIPARYGIMHSVGDTVGPAGLARSLRNIPVLVEIGRTVESVAPGAWLLNLTNPMTTITSALAQSTGLKVVGLCHGLFGVLREISGLLNEDVDAMMPVVGGINHFIWLLQLTADGRDLLPDISVLGNSKRFSRAGTDVEESWENPDRDRMLAKFALLKAYGCLPMSGDRHLAEFFPYFLSPETQYGMEYGIRLTTIEDRRAKGANNRARVEHLIAHPGEIPLSKSNEGVAEIMAQIGGGREVIHVVNLPNQGQIANLPQGAVVETMGVLGPGGGRGIAVGEMPRAVASLIERHVTNQELTVEAALSGNRNLALQVLLNDPLTREFGTAPRLLDELLSAHKAYLPQF